MARWRLTQKHYLKVPGTQWMQEETNVQTQKPMRKLYDVPLFLNPDDASDCNYPGEIIVCDGSNAQSRDIIFDGPPTPDMEPLDDDARAISDRLRPTWAHSMVESLEGNMGGAILTDLQRQISEIQSRPSAAAVSAPGISAAEFKELRDAVVELSQRNAALEAELDAMRPSE